MQRMNAPQLAAYLADADPLLLDVREAWEFEICHIDGSINLPMSQIPAHLEQLEGADEIVLICHHGIRSLRVAGYLQQALDATLINLDGGVESWAREVDPEMAVY
ncbi:MAG TPA: rhodanese-like domain-containing protein [Gammaproteobacteria bacterium]